ncbi:MAG: hypothetical protein LBC68_11210 [Prevotellaceae bacterium]|jgi:hypothetical protein|nr:hypothetical protein [Prevotellaceae bacterium]
MKTLIKLQKNTRNIIATTALFFVFGILTNSVNAQTRSYTLGVLQKTDYIIDEAYDIVDYFYFNDGEFIAKSVHFQDYAYYLYDLKRYTQALQYSLMARSYAINAIEICDDYWQYYDYHYYGYSPVWGRNSGFTVKIGNAQLHWGLTNARYHNNLRINWDLYFTARELNYYRNLPSEIVLLNGLYKHRGHVVYFNDRHANYNVYETMRTRINKGRESYVKSYPDATRQMSAKPKNIKPNNAPAPTHTRRETMNRTNDSRNTNYNNNNNRNEKNKPNEKNNNTGDNRRNDNNNKPNQNTGINNDNNGNRSTQTRRSTTSSSQTNSSGKVESKSNTTQDSGTRRQSTQNSETRRQSSNSSSSTSSSGSTTRRR